VITCVAVHADPARRRATVTLQSGQVAPRIIWVNGDGARVALVSTSATLLAGDDVQIGVSVGPGAWLELVDVAAVVAYHARGGRAAWSVDVRVAERGRLLWHGQPMVVSEGANVVRRTAADVAAGGVLLLRETYVLGRSGERGGSLWCSTRMSYDAQPLLAEDLDLRRATGPEEPGEGVGLLGSHRVVDTLTLAGVRAEPHGPVTGAAGAATYYRLAGTGSVARHLGAAAHLSPVAEVWRLWAAQVASHSQID